MKRYTVAAAVGVAMLGACGTSGDTGTGATVVALSPDSVRHSDHAFSPDGRQVAYWQPAADSAPGWQLWVADADLRNARPLPVTGLAVLNPVWSPDGSRLAAVSGQFGLADVVVVTLATGEVRRITSGQGFEIPTGWTRGDEVLSYFGTSTSGGLQARRVHMASGTDVALVPQERRPNNGAISRDGSRIAYVVLDGSRSTLWLTDSAGNDRRQLTTEGFEDITPFTSWSPDGTQLSYQSRRTGTTDLWTVPVDGGAPRQLTRNVRNDYEGVWSPDGRWLAFLSDRGRQTDIWIVSAAGGEEMRVTNTPAEERQLRWSAGGRLSFEIETERRAVWALDLATGTERLVTPDTLPVANFWVSPDGASLSLLIRRGGGVSEIAVVPMSGGAPRVLVSDNAAIDNLRWSPDGTRIAYESDRAGTFDIWVVDVDGGTPRAVVSWPSSEGGPTWSTDGTSILFRSDRESRLNDLWRVPAAGGSPTRVTQAGTLLTVYSRGMASDSPIVGLIGERGGQLLPARLQADGSLRPLWTRSNAIEVFDVPSSDSVAALVEQPDGTTRSMLLPNTGRGGRVILGAGELVSNTSFDGQSLLYQKGAAGVADLYLFDRRVGSTRRLTQTAESEDAAEFTPDDKTVLFRRVRTVRRIYIADVTRLLPRPAR